MGEADRTWLNAVEAHGPVVHSDVIHRFFANNGLRPVTAYVLMRGSEIVQPITKHLFCLPGAYVTDADVEAGAAQAIKIDSDPALTYDEDGTVVFETTAQQYMVRNGSLSSGPASTLTGRWKTVVKGEEVGEFTVGKPWIYGLAETQQVLNISMGDRIRIRFDTWTRQAEVSIVRRDSDY